MSGPLRGGFFLTHTVCVDATADIWWPQRHSMPDSVRYRPGSVLPDDSRRRTSAGLPQTGTHSLDFHPRIARSSEQDERQ